MKLLAVFLLSFLSLTKCVPVDKQSDVVPNNVVQVPPNCPPGQEWIDGQCRDVWRLTSFQPPNVVDVPPNCLPGQEWVDGKCRDIWRHIGIAWPQNVVEVPPNCPPGQEWVDGKCRDIWRQTFIRRPPNVVVVPPNCLPGQEWIDGQCRDIWFRSGNLIHSNDQIEFVKDLIQDREKRHLRNQNQKETKIVTITNRNIVNIPNKCPAGFKADALGICRPIW